MQVDLEKLVKSAGNNGWEFFEGLLGTDSKRPTSVDPAQLVRAEKLAHVWAQFYATDDGKLAIDHLIEITLGRPTFVAQLGLAMDEAYGHGCQREGQNAIVYMLLKMIAEGRKERLPERTA
jgi:hypothetical protein